MIAGDLDLERAARDPAYLRAVVEQAGLRARPSDDPASASSAQESDKVRQTPYAP